MILPNKFSGTSLLAGRQKMARLNFFGKFLRKKLEKMSFLLYFLGDQESLDQNRVFYNREKEGNERVK
jgi:hypothetical protein